MHDEHRHEARARDGRGADARQRGRQAHGDHLPDVELDIVHLQYNTENINFDSAWRTTWIILYRCLDSTHVRENN